MVVVFEEMFESFIHATCELCQGGSMPAMGEGGLFELVLQEIKTGGASISTGSRQSLKKKKWKYGYVCLISQKGFYITFMESSLTSRLFYSIQVRNTWIQLLLSSKSFSRLWRDRFCDACVYKPHWLKEEKELGHWCTFKMHFCWEYVSFSLLNVRVIDSPEPSVLFDGNLRQFNGYLSTKGKGEDRISIAFPRKINIWNGEPSG